MRANTIGRFLGRALLLVAATTGGVAALATPSMAATCNWADCNDKDPQATGCSSSVTQMDYAYYGGNTAYSLELRRGNNCTAMWVRLIHDSCFGGHGADNWYVAIEEEVSTPYGYYPISEGTATGGTSTCDGGREWSYMREYDHRTNRYRMCAEHRAPGSATPGRYDHLANCTDWKYY